MGDGCIQDSHDEQILFNCEIQEIKKIFKMFAGKKKIHVVCDSKVGEKGGGSHSRLSNNSICLFI